MSELSTTLIVIAAVLFVIVQSLGVAGFAMLLMQGRRIKELTDKNASLTNANEKLTRGQRIMGKLLAKVRKSQLKSVAARATDKTELVNLMTEGQFKLAELMTTGFKANADYMNAVSKAATDSNFDLVTKNTDDVLKLNTTNSQKVYDAMVVLIQMMNGLMTALGYRPAAPESGLQEPKRGQNYGQPPAPEDQDGLTFAK